jgi:hypothetical protein
MKLKIKLTLVCIEDEEMQFEAWEKIKKRLNQAGFTVTGSVNITEVKDKFVK